MRTTSLPARGLFAGDQLTDAAKHGLADFIVEAIGLQVEIALLAPTGPWQIDGGRHANCDLDKAWLRAAPVPAVARRRPRRIFVESRIDAKLSEPWLAVDLVGAPAD